MRIPASGYCTKPVVGGAGGGASILIIFLLVFGQGGSTDGGDTAASGEVAERIRELEKSDAVQTERLNQKREDIAVINKKIDRIIENQGEHKSIMCQISPSSLC